MAMQCDSSFPSWEPDRDIKPLGIRGDPVKGCKTSWEYVAKGYRAEYGELSWRSVSMR